MDCDALYDCLLCPPQAPQVQVLFGVPESVHTPVVTTSPPLWDPEINLKLSSSHPWDFPDFLLLPVAQIVFCFPAEGMGKDLNASCGCVKFIWGTGIPSSPVYSLFSSQKNQSDRGGIHTLHSTNQCFSH